MKFMRRKDVSVEVRITIAMLALVNKGIYGAITRIAWMHDVSRKFVYELVWAAQFALAIEFSPLPEPTRPSETFVDKLILLLRLEGKCSQQSISNILTTLGFSPNSLGTISQRLKRYAQKLPQTLKAETLQFVLFLSDELFAKGQPILITIEPKSTAILRIELAQERTAQRWKEHWTAIEHNQFYTLGLVSDRAKGLVEGFKDLFADTPHSFDLFHGITHLAKVALVDMEKAAYKAIADEDDRWIVLDSARSQQVINKRIADYEKAAEVATQAIERYENASYLFRCIQQSLELFDQQGHLQDAQSAREEIQAALELMNEIDCPSLKAQVNKFYEQLDSMLLYFQRAQQVYQELSELIADSEALKALSLAWQCNHKFYQANNTKEKHYYQKEQDFLLEYTQALLGKKFQVCYQQTFEQLDTIVRSSSLVEMVNSLIRPYLNTCKGNITQETLNLIMFYHNHRKFNGGKRKNRAPIEILTGKPLQQHWLDLLMAA